MGTQQWILGKLDGGEEEGVPQRSGLGEGGPGRGLRGAASEETRICAEGASVLSARAQTQGR